MDISAGAHGVSLPKGSDGAVSCVHAAGQADAAVAAPLPGRRDGRRAASGDADQQQAAQHQHQHEYAPAQRQAGQARRQGPRRQQSAGQQPNADHQQRAARQRRQGDGLEQPQRQHAAEHARLQGDGIVAGGAGVGEHGRSGAGDNRALSTLCRKRYPRNVFMARARTCPLFIDSACCPPR
ncbi:hypothetical protein G6F65_020651 [Rhizopus arrhizus]|nr:hypothetical protein G6F65_020651 [Rhizopus arrhizus]